MEILISDKATFLAYYAKNKNQFIGLVYNYTEEAGCFLTLTHGGLFEVANSTPAPVWEEEECLLNPGGFLTILLKIQTNIKSYWRD